MRFCLQFAISSILCLCLLSCNNGLKTDKEIINALEENLVSSNQCINSSSQTNLWKLESKLSEPATHYKAEVWFPKAKRIYELSLDCYNYIEQLKRGATMTEKKSLVLLEKLDQYTLSILNIDSLIHGHFSKVSFVKKDSSNNSDKVFFVSIFKNAKPESIKDFLTKLQNDVRVFENRTVSFCNEQVSNNSFIINVTSAIISQSSKIVEPGKEINITAGIGSFSKKANPQIIIDGREIPLTDSGFSRYKLKTPTKPGIYHVPVKIKFVDEYNEEQVLYSRIKYTVAKICDE